MTENARRITLFAGHYGSGKTNIALNYAKALRRAGERVAIADLDIVNPYFRTKDSAADLRAEGIDLVVSDFANSNVDFPALPKEIYALVAPAEHSEQSNNRTILHVVMDIGGDDRGALALGRYAPFILEENNYEMLLVINQYRPLTRDLQSTLEVMREIEAAGGIPFTGIVNNSNLGRDTTAEDVIATDAYAKEMAAATGLCLRMTTVKDDIAGEVAKVLPNVVPLHLQNKRLWND